LTGISFGEAIQRKLVLIAPVFVQSKLSGEAFFAMFKTEEQKQAEKEAAAKEKEELKVFSHPGPL
jgi:hypothetical protein